MCFHMMCSWLPPAVPVHHQTTHRAPWEGAEVVSPRQHRAVRIFLCTAEVLGKPPNCSCYDFQDWLLGCVLLKQIYASLRASSQPDEVCAMKKCKTALEYQGLILLWWEWKVTAGSGMRSDPGRSVGGPAHLGFVCSSASCRISPSQQVFGWCQFLWWLSYLA